jgi:hypothetical protein
LVVYACMYWLLLGFEGGGRAEAAAAFIDEVGSMIVSTMYSKADRLVHEVESKRAETISSSC